MSSSFNDIKDQDIFLQPHTIQSSFSSQVGDSLKSLSLRSSLSMATSTKKEDIEKDRFTINKVVVIGLGQLGLPVARYVKERGFDTFGYDINPKAMENAESNFGIKKATTFKDFDVLIICVSTHRHDDIFSPQTDGLMSVVEKISRESKTGALVSIESTIPKGTSKKVFEKVDHRLHVVHAPHRWYALEEKEHGVNQLRIIGGVSNCCLQYGLRFYDGSHSVVSPSPFQSSSADDKVVLFDPASSATVSDIAAAEDLATTTNTASLVPSSSVAYISSAISSNSRSSTSKGITRPSLVIPMHPVSSIEVAELTKIIENAHRYLQIAFAEELYLYCKVNGISFTELRDSLNTKWNVEILEPRDGIGGHCLPKDTKMFINSSDKIRSKILQAAMEIDESYRNEHIQKKERRFLNTNVLVIGDDFDIANIVKESLEKNGFTVKAFNDPLLALEYFKTNSKEITIIISDIVMPSMNGMDLVSKIKEIEPNIKAIFITAFDTDFIESALKKYDYKIDGIFQKPLRNKDLCDFVNLLLLPLVR